MKIVIAPGAFKHSLTARQAAEAIARGLRESALAAELLLLPIADGGNGTLDAFLAAGGQRITVKTTDALGRPLLAEIGLLPDAQTAIVEMALASGLEKLRFGELNPLVTSTGGTGLLMQAALNSGARRIIVGMGGSATVDGGAGALAALGAQLLDAYGQPVEACGGTLGAVQSVDLSNLDPRWAQVELILASDVRNPAVGADGAAAVFGPQKGAGPHEIRLLEAGLRHFLARLAAVSGRDVLHTEGGGAAGTLAAGLMSALGGRIESGVDLLLDHNGFDAALTGAGLVITGEGKLDSQTLGGKGPLGAAQRARNAGVPTVALVGGLDAPAEALREAGFAAVLPITPRPCALQEALEQADAWLADSARRLGDVLAITPSRGWGQ